MNNKGFTLIELLAVIILLGVIVTIAVPSISSISKKTKEQMLNSKIALMEEAAKLYGEDNLSVIANARETLHTGSDKANLSDTGYKCEVKTIGDLVKKGYIKLDREESNVGYVINPVDNTNMYDKNIIIYLKNKRVNAFYEVEEKINESTGTKEYTYYDCR